MGRNHHINLFDKIKRHSADYWIEDVDNFIKIGHCSVIYYSEIRTAICFYQKYMNRYRIKPIIYTDEKIRWAKNKRKELSRALDKLDHYMQNKVGGLGGRI